MPRGACRSAPRIPGPSRGADLRRELPALRLPHSVGWYSFFAVTGSTALRCALVSESRHHWKTRRQAIDTQPLLGLLRSFCFARGEQPALGSAIRTTESGYLQMSPEARCIPFTAKQVFDTTQSRFHRQARLDPGKLTSLTISNAYEKARGTVAIKLASLIPARRFAGPEVDRAELQHYLASLVFFPPMLLNHVALEFKVVAPLVLRFWDRHDRAATVDVELSDSGSPLACRAERPRVAGKRFILTRWSATASEFHILEGLRVPFHLQAAWHLAHTTFTYYQSRITSFEVLREYRRAA